VVVNDSPGVPDRPECPSGTALAEYVEGMLGPRERDGLERHLLGCADCREVVAEAAMFAAAELPVAVMEPHPAPLPFRPPSRRSWRTVAYAGLSAAAALIIAFQALRPAPARTPPDLAGLMAATSAQSTRLTDARLAGFPYAPAPVHTRDVSRPDVPSTVHDAAVSVGRAAAGHDFADHAAGIASLALGDADAAVASLRRAAERSPGDARAWSDLSAALVSRAESQGAPEDARAALAACDRAFAVSATLPEALFNRALALEILGPSEAAARAWADYLRVDSTSKWSDEARARSEVLR